MIAEDLLIKKIASSELELQLVKSYIDTVNKMREDYISLQALVISQKEEIAILKKQNDEYKIFWEG